MNRDTTEILKVSIDDEFRVKLAMADRKEGWEIKGYKCNRTCSPDFNTELNELASYLAESNGLIIEIPKDAAKEIVKLVNRLNTKMMESITVRGVTFKGEGDDTSIVIDGNRKFLHTDADFKSPEIHLAGEVFGFEKEIAPILDSIVEEAKAYVFDGKGGLFEHEEKEKEAAEV